VEGVRVAVYVVPEPVKLESVPPPVTVTSSEVKSIVDSLGVNVKRMLASFEIKPLLPSAAVIVIVGDVVSYVHSKVLDSTLTLPARSVYTPEATLIDCCPSVEGVRVAVYVVPEPVKLESVPPPVTVTSSDVKSLVDSLNVNVKLMLASFEVKPLNPSADVIVIVGDVVS